MPMQRPGTTATLLRLCGAWLASRRPCCGRMTGPWRLLDTAVSCYGSDLEMYTRYWVTDKTRLAVDVNYFGSAEMSQAIMRAWLSPRQTKQQNSAAEPRPAAKHIIFTGSVLSTFSMAGHGTYAPSKFALRALADALVMETRLYPDVPIDVHLVMPNSITTAGYERENETKAQITLQLEGAEVPQHPDDVARLSIAGLRKGHYFVTTSFLGELMRWGAMSNSPRNNWLVDTLMGWILPFILAFVMWDMNSQVSAWAKKEKKKHS